MYASKFIYNFSSYFANKQMPVLCRIMHPSREMHPR